MSAKDMVQINNIDKLLDLNVASFKIEGRMKSMHYIATVVNAYKKAMQRYYDSKEHYIEKKDLEEELLNAANRETDDAWFSKNPGYEKMLYHDEEKKLTQNYAFIIKNKHSNFYQVITKNKIKVNDEIEIISPRHQNKIKTKIIRIMNSNFADIDSCPTPMSKIYLQFETTKELDYPDIGRII